MSAMISASDNAGGLLRYLHTPKQGDTGGDDPTSKDRNAGGDVEGWKAVVQRWADDRKGYQAEQRRTGWPEDVTRARRQRRDRQAYHLILSPDPAHPVDVDTLYQMAATIADQYCPEFEYHIVMHQQKNKPLHAHIAVNAIKDTRDGKLHLPVNHIDKLRDIKQTVCADFGVYVTPGTNAPRLTRGERELLKKGKEPWKQRLKATLDHATGNATTETELVAFLEKQGVTYDRRHSTWAFCDPEADGKARPSIRAQRLGADYSLDRLCVRTGERTTKRLREKLDAAFALAETPVQAMAALKANGFAYDTGRDEWHYNGTKTDPLGPDYMFKKLCERHIQGKQTETKRTYGGGAEL